MATLNEILNRSYDDEKTPLESIFSTSEVKPYRGIRVKDIQDQPQTEFKMIILEH